MKPLDDMINQVIQGDCLEVMRDIPDGSVDCVITSPPYNMNLRIREGKYCSRQIVKEFSTKYHQYDDNLMPLQYYRLLKESLYQMLRLSPLVFFNIMVCTGNKLALFKLIGEYATSLKDIVIWDKGNFQPAMQDGVISRQSELILVFDRDNAISRRFEKFNFDRGSIGDIWKVARPSKSIEGHGATFPIEIPQLIIKNFTNPNDLILDPFLGSGTTAVAALNEGRRFIGIEQSSEYCEIARKRIARETAQGRLPF